MSLVCANALNEDYAVIGVDLPTEVSLNRINGFNEGIFPLAADDPKIEIFFQNSREKGNFYATFDPLAFEFADIVIVDVNLDVNKSSNVDFSLNSYDVELDQFKKAVSTIGKFCKSNVLIIVETTVPPGTCEKVVKPILFDEFSKRNLETKCLKIGHSYERVPPGLNISIQSKNPRVNSY